MESETVLSKLRESYRNLKPDYLLNEAYRRYIKGNKESLLEAIYYCAVCNVVMPDWVASGYVNGYENYFHHKEKDLGSSFGVIRRNNYRQNAERKKTIWRYWSYLKVKGGQSSGSKINTRLFNEIGNEFGIGGSLVRDYYYEMEKEFREHEAETKSSQVNLSWPVPRCQDLQEK